MDSQLLYNHAWNMAWNNHGLDMLKIFAGMYERGELVDVTLSCEGQFLKAHKLVLAAASPYFRELFDYHQQVRHPVIIMDGNRFDNMQAIVEYMYTGELKIPDGGLESIWKTAQHLRLKNLDVLFANRMVNQRPAHHIINLEPFASTSAPTAASGLAQQGVGAGTFSGLTFARGNGGGIFTEAYQTPAKLPRVMPPVTPTAALNAMKSPDPNETRNGAVGGFNGHASGLTSISPSITHEDTRDGFPSPVKGNIAPRQLHFSSADESNESHSLDSHFFGGSCSSNSSSVAKHAVEKPEAQEKIRRPPNPFLLFASDWRKRVIEENPNARAAATISGALGAMWNDLPQDVKQIYFERAAQEKEEFNRKYPDYSYSHKPKEARTKKAKRPRKTKSPSLTTTDFSIYANLVKEVQDHFHARATDTGDPGEIGTAEGDFSADGNTSRGSPPVNGHHVVKNKNQNRPENFVRVGVVEIPIFPIND